LRIILVVGCSGPSAFSSIARARFVERFGVGIAALSTVQPGEVVELDGDVRVFRSERLLVDREGALVERFGVGIAALSTVQPGEVVKLDGDVRAGGDVRMVRSERLLAPLKPQITPYHIAEKRLCALQQSWPPDFRNGSIGDTNHRDRHGGTCFDSGLTWLQGYGGRGCVIPFRPAPRCARYDPSIARPEP
jgi:hypothetical protein